jgi:hypothetical protein
MLLTRLSQIAFAVSALFAAGEPGAHFEAYNPDSLLLRRNQLTYSSQLSNAVWLRTNIQAVTDNADGVGDLMVPNATVGFHAVQQSIANVGGPNVGVARVKAGGYSWIAIQLGASICYFDIGNGVVGAVNQLNGTIAAAADAPGYYDCFVSAVPSNNNFIVYTATGNGVASHAGDGVSGIYIARAQVEWYTSTPSAYQEVTDWNTEYVYSGTPTPAPNVALDPADLSTGNWIKSKATVTASGADWKITEDNTAGQHFVGQVISTIASAEKSQATVRLKAGPRSVVQIGLGAGGAVFDLAAGAVASTSGCTASIAPVAGGYYDCYMGNVDTSVGGSNLIIYPMRTVVEGLSYTGDGAGYLLVKSVSVSSMTPITTVNPAIGMWQDHIGTAPVTAVEQTVGLWMDTKAGLARGASALNLTTLNFTAGWTSVGTGAAVSANTFSCAGTGGEGLSKAVLTVGKTYEVIVDFTKLSTGTFFIANASGSGVPTVSSSANGTSGRLRGVFIATNASLYFRLSAAPDTVTITGLTVTEVSSGGSHATQATAGSRPKLSARYNLFTKTEGQLSDAAWVASECTGSGNTVTASATSGVAKVIRQSAPPTTGTVPHLQRCRLKAGTQRYVQLLVINDGNIAVNLDLQTGAYAVVGTRAAFASVAVSAASGGWFDVAFTYTSDTPVASMAGSVVFVDSMAAARGATTTAIGTTFDMTQFDVRTAGDAALAQPAYQRVNTATDYDTAGFIHYLRFDGTDDGLQTGNVDFSAASKLTLWAGFTKLSDAAAVVLTELGPTATTTDGTFGFFVPGTSGQSPVAVYMRGTASTNISAYAMNAAPATACATILLDYAAGTAAAQSQFRLSGGAAVVSNGGATTAAAMASQVLNIGRRNNATNPFNGRITTLTVRGSTTPASTAFIKSMEQYAARLAGQSFVST